MPDRIREPKAVHEYEAHDLDGVFEFLKRTRDELRALRRVRVAPDWLRIIDVNRACFEIRGLGYASPEIIDVLDNLKVAYKRELIHEPVDAVYKEFKTGKCDPWAEHRVM